MSCKIKTSIIVKILSDAFHQWFTRVLMTTLRNFVHHDKEKSSPDKIILCEIRRGKLQVVKTETKRG